MKISNKVYPRIKQYSSVYTVIGLGLDYYKKLHFVCLNEEKGICEVSVGDQNAKLVSPYDKHTLDIWVQQNVGVTIYKTRNGVSDTKVGIYPLQESELRGTEEYPKLLSNGVWVYWRDLLFKEPLPLSVLLRDEWEVKDGTTDHADS